MMNDRSLMQQPAGVGLCAACRHGQVVVSDRGSRFILCRRAAWDEAFSRYPMVPVVRCRGFEPRIDAAAAVAPETLKDL